MALKKLYIEGVEGLNYVQHTDLHTGAEVLLVLREGKLLVETSETPTGKRFKHAGGETKIVFDADLPIVAISMGADPGGMTDLVRPEIIYVEYKSN
jgi:hypothetical protein